MTDDHSDAVDAAYDAQLAAEEARDAAQSAADLVQEQAQLTDEQVARGVEAAADQQTLKNAAANLEKEGWTVQRVEPGRITLSSATSMNWWLHGILPFFTLFLSLIWTSKELKKPRGTMTLTLDQLGRVQQRKP